MPSEQLTEEAIFQVARRISPAEAQGEYLHEVCGNDPQLLKRVMTLLRAHDRANDFLLEPPPGLGVVHDNDGLAEGPGSVIGPYRLLEQIGEGGFGVVFLAEQERPVRRRVALKVIKPGMDTREVIARFEAERQALAMMDHPNIAKVHDAGATENGRPYFVMELVQGVPITEYCDQCNLTTKERLQLFVTVCQAVQHAHQKGIIHRDLKPTNVLVALQDGKAAPKVIDFGVAKAIGEQTLTERTLTTAFAQMVGTPMYMSPEQAELSPLGVDTRSDIYSLGVMLYELLAGATPFDKDRLHAASYDELRRIIREEEPPRPSTRLSTLAADLATTVAERRRTDRRRLSRSIHGELDWIVMKCLEKDRNRRYDTASGLERDIEGYLHDEPVLACPPSAWYRFRKFARRQRRALVTASVIALAVVLTAAGSGGLIWRANQDLHQALDRERDTLERERRNSYRQRIALADREWYANNLSGIEALLNECSEDLRGWEWHYLKRLRYSAHLPLRHDSAVLSAAFSPDGQFLATATQDGVLRLWQTTTGQERRKWQAHPENATSVVFSPDGRRLATGSWDGSVKVWDMEKVLHGEVSEPLLQLEFIKRVWSVAFSPDGQRLAAAAGRTTDSKGEVKVWDLTSPREALTLSFTDRITCVQFSPDGRKLATGGVRSVELWDAETGRRLLTFPGHEANTQAVAFSPDGRRLAAVAGLINVHPDSEIKIWDTHTGRAIFSLRGHVGGLRSVAYGPDGRCLVSAGLDQTIKLWDAATGKEVLTLRGHLDHIYNLAFSPDGRRLASASLDKTVRIWDATPMEQEPTPEFRTFRGHTGAVTDVAFHPTDGRSLVSADTDGTVRVWDFGSGEALGALHEPPSSVRVRVAYSPDGSRLAAASSRDAEQQQVTVWDIAAEKEDCKFLGHKKAAVLSVAFSPDGRHVASADADLTVRVWDATTAQEVQSLKDHSWPIHEVTFSPDGRQLAAGSADSTVRVWDWTSGQKPRVLEPGHAARVASVAFSRDGELLASGSWDRSIKVWDRATWELQHDLSDVTGAVLCVAFGANRRLTWGSTDSTVKVWDGPDTKIHVLRGHTSWVEAVAFSPDGKWIGSASLDGTVKIWQSPPEPSAGNQRAQNAEQ